MTDNLRDGVLLTMGDYYGTLAATRCYGKAGVEVVLAEAKELTQTRCSRFVQRREKAPPLTQPEAFVRWLVDFGRKTPGYFLYSTSDDMSWLLASRQDELRPFFRMYQPPLDTIAALLDKKRLYEACAALGIDTPQTWFPGSDEEVRGLAASVPSPTLIKPRTQMLLDSKRKGALVREPGELPGAYRRFRQENTYQGEILAYDPTMSWPMLQRYHPEAMVDTYSLSGFVDEAGEVFVVRASRKVFQRPRQLGVGLCFVSEPVNPALRQKIFELTRRVGYHGAFEAEFVHAADKHLLIDFNPRFYGQMGFEIAREMPLPLFVYHAARGKKGDELRAAVAHRAEPPAQSYHFSNRWVLRLVMHTQSLSGRLSADDRAALDALLDDPQALYVDAVGDPRDTGPLVADVLLNVSQFARHPRDFVKKFFLDA